MLRLLKCLHEDYPKLSNVFNPLSFNSCFAPAKFLELHSKEVWKSSSLHIHSTRSNQPPLRTCPPLPGPPSRSGSPSSRLKLPADPPRALPGSPEPPPPPPPAAPHVLGARVAAGPTHRLRASHSRVSSRGPVRTKLKRPGQGRQTGVRTRSAAAGLYSPLTRPLRAGPVHRHRHSQSQPAFARPLGRRLGTAPRLPSTRPAPVLPATS